jgi:hypothetical protein
MALKYLARGCHVNSLRDYFDMGESTAMTCVKLLIKLLQLVRNIGISICPQ